MKIERSRFEFFWEIPLALSSFLFYKTARFCIQFVVRIQAMLSARGRKQPTSEWRVLSGEALQSPFVLPAIMTSGPRWNTHALIAIAGPLAVRRTLRLRVASALQSARSWTVVVHASPGHHIVASLGSLSVPEQEAWASIPLAPGNYRLALRFYRYLKSAELPIVEVDGVAVVPAITVSENANGFYQALRRRSNLFYLGLHYYIGPLLRYRRWLSQAFVEREYLPAGNPETEFYFGFIRAGESLTISLAPQVLQTYDVFLTLYDRASFPTLWYSVPESAHLTPASPATGSYLVRVHKIVPTPEPFIRDWVQITVAHPALPDQTVGKTNGCQVEGTATQSLAS